jgi:hypothetical protein
VLPLQTPKQQWPSVVQQPPQVISHMPPQPSERTMQLFCGQFGEQQAPVVVLHSSFTLAQQLPLQQSVVHVGLHVPPHPSPTVVVEHGGHCGVQHCGSGPAREHSWPAWQQAEPQHRVVQFAGHVPLHPSLVLVVEQEGHWGLQHWPEALHSCPAVQQEDPQQMEEQLTGQFPPHPFITAVVVQAGHDGEQQALPLQT